MACDVLFFAINGSGMGHLSRCLAYARHLPKNMSASFFTLTSAVEFIEEMGFEADYFISPFWSANDSLQWNSELAVRFGMLLERLCPKVVVFDGTWPFQGFWGACMAWRKPLKLVWSRRGLLKESVKDTHVRDDLFDLVIHPGELSDDSSTPGSQSNRLAVGPVALLDEDELLSRTEARRALHLPDDGKLALISPGPGNLKDVDGLGKELINRFQKQGWHVIWARAPITTKDMPLPPGVRPVSVFPLVRYMRAFDAMAGAAGYNTCCEVVQAQIPTILVPNEMVVDDQIKRAGFVCKHAPAVVSSCASGSELDRAFDELLEKIGTPQKSVKFTGASQAASAIATLVESA